MLVLRVVRCDAAFLMYERAVSRLPVVDQGGHLVGIISQVDVLRVFGRPDEEIRREVTGRLIGMGFPADPEHLQVSVHDGHRDPDRAAGNRPGRPGHHRGRAAYRRCRCRPGPAGTCGRPPAHSRILTTRVRPACSGTCRSALDDAERDEPGHLPA
jgi:CBS domain